MLNKLWNKSNLLGTIRMHLSLLVVEVVASLQIEARSRAHYTWSRITRSVVSCDSHRLTACGSTAVQVQGALDRPQH